MNRSVMCRVDCYALPDKLGKTGDARARGETRRRPWCFRDLRNRMLDVFIDAARIAAEGAEDLAALKVAVAAFEGCELKRGAKDDRVCRRATRRRG